MSRKEKILEVAAKLFAVKGFKDASVSELAKLTGVAEGTIFYHFKNKEELFIAVLESLRETIIHDFEEFVADVPFKNGMHMMEEVVSFYLLMAAHREERYRLLYRHFPYALAEVNERCRAHLEAIYTCLVDMFERAVLTGQADGSIGPVPARKSALLIFTMVDGMVRFRMYNLYDSGALAGELIASCRRILEPLPKDD